VEARGGAVRVNAPGRIHAGAGLLVRVRDEELRANAVICAAAWHALPGTFVEPPAALQPVLEAASRTAASPIVTVNLWLDRPVTRGMFLGLPGRTMQWVFDKRSLFGETSSHLSLVSSGAGAIVARGNQDLIDLAMQELAEAVPASRGAVARRAVVVREKHATFSVAPGQPPRPPVHTAVPGLFLAGDWIDTGLPATIESAVLSGHQAAEAAFHHARR
jgi:zeta-carotene desaturase